VENKRKLFFDCIRVKRNRFVFKFTESNIYLCAAQIPCENLEFKCLFGNELQLFFKIFFMLKYIKKIFFIFKKLFLKSMHQTIQNIKKINF